MKKGEAKGPLDALKRALEVEYAFIVHYPRVAKMMPDEELASKVEALGRHSIRHADMVSKTISALGEVAPFPILEALPEPLDLRVFFLTQLELEKLALMLHTEASEGVTGDLASPLLQMADQEREHIKTVEEILSRLE